MPPQVRELQSLIKEQNKALQPHYDLIDSDIARTEQSGVAQVAGLEAQQKQAFGQIEQAASDKGMFFSGFSPSEQAGYTSTTFLPALAELQNTIASARSNLLGKKADFGKGAFDAATAMRETDIGRRFTYDERVSSQQFQSQEAEKQRQFTAAENQRDRNAAAAQASQAAAKQDYSGVVSSVKAFLDPRRGGDGKVSPNTFQQARNIWVGAGGDPASFAQSFIGYVNRSHESDYF